MIAFLLACILLALIAPRLLGFLFGLAIIGGFLAVAAIIFVAIFV
jgi:hypothetical protein